MGNKHHNDDLKIFQGPTKGDSRLWIKPKPGIKTKILMPNGKYGYIWLPSFTKTGVNLSDLQSMPAERFIKTVNDIIKGRNYVVKIHTEEICELRLEIGKNSNGRKN